MRRLVVLLIFLLSGSAGLIYQVVWMRQLTLIVGVTSQAVSTVLAVFMGGLALGSWLMGRAGDESRSPLRLYGWLELGIALFGVQSLLLLRGAMETFPELKAWSGEWFPAVRLGIACLALIGPTTLMGATLPILIKGVCKSRKRIARESGLLYGINTLGAVLGTLFAAFWLVENLGIRGTTYVAAGLNLAVGLAALGMARLDDRREETWSEEEEEREELIAESDLPPLPDPGQRRTGRVVLFAFAISGSLALAYEVLWTRYLIYVVGENSVFAFATMLAAFLTGIALGSFIAAAVADRVRNRVALLGGVFVLLGATAALTVTLMGVVRASVDWELPWGSDFLGYTSRNFLRSLAVLIVPTTLSGSTFAIVARIYARDMRSLGQDAGRAYAVNTLGAIFGALAGGFLVLPYLGLQHGILALSVLNVLLGLWLLLRDGPYGRAVTSAAVTGCLAVLAIASALLFAEKPQTMLEDWWGAEDGVSAAERIVYYAESPESSVAVVREGRDHDGEYDYGILVDGEGQAGTDRVGQIHLRLLGHLPGIFHHDPKEVLVVAYGAGVTTGCLLQHDIDHLDQVELNPKVISGAAPWFASKNHDPVGDPRFRAHIDDGRNFLLTTDKTYDVISSDPIDPNDRGTTSLYCVEYYELVRERLNDGGLACQWITTGMYGKQEFDMLVRTFQSVFPRTAIWYAAGTTVVVGYKDEPRMSLADLRAKFDDPKIAASLAYVGIDSAEVLLAMMLAGPRAVEEMVWTGDPAVDVLNTDDRPRIEYFHSRGRGGWDADGDEEREMEVLVRARSLDHSDWLVNWTAEDVAACEPAHRWMDVLLSDEIAQYRWWDEEQDAEDATAGGEVDAAESPEEPSPEERDASSLASAKRDEMRQRARLTELWKLIGDDVDRVILVLCGLVAPEPGREATDEQKLLYQEGMSAGLAAFAAEDWAAANQSFLAVADDVPGAERAILLSAATHDLRGDPLAGLETLLAFDEELGGDDEWDDWGSARQYVREFVPLCLAAMARAEDAEARALGLRLSALTPSDDTRPAERPRSRWGDWGRRRDGRPWPPRDRPAGATLGDADAWRLWWSDVSFALEVKDGGFAWRGARAADGGYEADG